MKKKAPKVKARGLAPARSKGAEIQQPSGVTPTASANKDKQEVTRRRQNAPKKLSEKLIRIRKRSDLSQGQMLKIIRPDDDELMRARISQYESGERVPSLVEVYRYSKYANIAMEVLVRDDVDLPF